MKRVLACVLAVLPVTGLPVTGTAQEVVFSSLQTESCLQEAISDAERKACIGVSAGACMEASPQGSTTYGMSMCMGGELGFWDDYLNDAYGALMAATKGSDPERAGALRDMQRAWIGFRDATCTFERTYWGGGTGGGPAQISCLAQMTGEQALYLEASGAEY